MPELGRGEKRALGCLAVAGVAVAVVVLVLANREGDRVLGAGAAASSQAPAYGVVPGSAAAPPSPSPSPSVVVSDDPAFDLTGSGDACRMHYFQDGQGRTVTLFTLASGGELITHVSGPDGVGRHDAQESAGPVRIVYDFPLAQATDMGAVLYLGDGSSQSCTISAGSDTP